MLYFNGFAIIYINSLSSFVCLSLSLSYFKLPGGGGKESYILIHLVFPSVCDVTFYCIRRSAAEPAIRKSIIVWNAFRAATAVVDAASNSPPLQFVAHRNDEEKVHISSSYSSCLITECFGFVF